MCGYKLCGSVGGCICMCMHMYECVGVYACVCMCVTVCLSVRESVVIMCLYASYSIIMYMGTLYDYW